MSQVILHILDILSINKDLKVFGHTFLTTSYSNYVDTKASTLSEKIIEENNSAYVNYWNAILDISSEITLSRTE